MISSSHTSVANQILKPLKISPRKSSGHPFKRIFQFQETKSGATSHANPLLDLCCLKGKLHPWCTHRVDLGNISLSGLVIRRFLLGFHILLKIFQLLCNVRNLKRENKTIKPHTTKNLRLHDFHQERQYHTQSKKFHKV